MCNDKIQSNYTKILKRHEQMFLLVLGDMPKNSTTTNKQTQCFFSHIKMDGNEDEEEGRRKVDTSVRSFSVRISIDSKL